MNEFKTPLEVRLACRRNELQGAASSALSGYLCVNIVMMDKEHADDMKESWAVRDKSLQRDRFLLYDNDIVLGFNSAITF